MANANFTVEALSSTSSPAAVLEPPTSSATQPGSSDEGVASNDADSDDEIDGVLVEGRLYMIGPGSFLAVHGDQLVIRRRGADPQRIALDTLSTLLLQGPGIGISAELMVTLGERGVPVIFAPLCGPPTVVASSFNQGPVRLKHQQIARRDDPEVLASGVSMLAAKVGNQASVLKYFARYRKRCGAIESHRELTRSADAIRSIAAAMAQLDVSMVNVRHLAMGHEGRAAAAYWSSLSRLVPEELGFPGRRTRDATDPFNQTINYIYALLYAEVWKAVARAGLDPYAGIMHGTERDQGSLVFDAIEEFRAPFADRLALGLLGRGFRPHLAKAGELRLSTRRLLIRAFHRLWGKPIRWRGGTTIPPSRILQEQCKNLARMFLGDDSYRPFQFRW